MEKLFTVRMYNKYNWKQPGLCRLVNAVAIRADHISVAMDRAADKARKHNRAATDPGAMVRELHCEGCLRLL